MTGVSHFTRRHLRHWDSRVDPGVEAPPPFHLPHLRVVRHPPAPLPPPPPQAAVLTSHSPTACALGAPSLGMARREFIMRSAGSLFLPITSTAPPQGQLRRFYPPVL